MRMHATSTDRKTLLCSKARRPSFPPSYPPPPVKCSNAVDHFGRQQQSSLLDRRLQLDYLLGRPLLKERREGAKEGGRGVEETIERAAARPEKDIDELLSCQADMERLSVYLTIVCLTRRSARENQDSRMSHACRFTHSHIHTRRMQAGRV